MSPRTRARRRRADEDRRARDGAAVGEVDGVEPVVDNRQASDTTLDHRDAARVQRRPFGRADRRCVREEDEVVGPLPQQVRVIDGGGRRAEHADRPVANLPAVAVGAVEEVAAPELSDAGNVGQLVDCPGCEEQASRRHAVAAGKPEREARSDLDHTVVDELHAVALHFRATGGHELGRRHPVAREEALHVRRGSIARRARIDHDDAAPRPAEHERRAQPGRAPADDRHVESAWVHGLDVARERRRAQLCCRFRDAFGSSP